METFPRYWPFVRGIQQSLWILLTKASGHRWIPPTQASDAEMLCFFDLCLNKRLNKQSRSRCFKTSLCPLWRHCNVDSISVINHKSPGCFLVSIYIYTSFYKFQDHALFLKIKPHRSEFLFGHMIGRSYVFSTCATLKVFVIVPLFTPFRVLCEHDLYGILFYNRSMCAHSPRYHQQRQIYLQHGTKPYIVHVWKLISQNDYNFDSTESIKQYAALCGKLYSNYQSHKSKSLSCYGHGSNDIRKQCVSVFPENHINCKSVCIVVKTMSHGLPTAI